MIAAQERGRRGWAVRNEAGVYGRFASSGTSLMGRAILAISGTAAALLPRPFALLGSGLAAYWHDLARHLFNPYRPERHYMRGPGPACRAKSAGQSPV